MKRNAVLTAVAMAAVFLVGVLAQDRSQPAAEYATIRWAGRENTHVIRPGGKVEFIGAELRKLRKPEDADDRSFYLNAAINGLAREGYAVVAITPDDVVMKR